jgi:hypothetical protein
VGSSAMGISIVALATEQDACREHARNVGREFPEGAWISTPYDTWGRNPFYQKYPFYG